MAGIFSVNLNTITGKSNGTATGYITLKKQVSAALASGTTETGFFSTTKTDKRTIATFNYTSANDTYAFSTDSSASTAVFSIKGSTTSVLNLKTGSAADVVSLKSVGDGSTIDGGAGNNLVSIESGNSLKITTGGGKDSIAAVGNDVTVNSGAGNDSVSLSGANVVIDAGTGNDSIYASSAAAKITAGAGNDYVSVSSANATVDGGAGNDQIYSTGGSSYITAGDGNDTVSVAGAGVTINAGAGNDSVLVASDDATITLGAGTDTVSLGTANVTLTDYAFGTDKIVVAGAATLYKAAAATASNTAFGTDGKLAFNEGGSQSVTVGTTNGFYAAEITTGTGAAAKTTAFAWATAEGGTINASSYKKGAIIVGTNNDDMADLIIGSAGADTIYAGSNDTVYGGKGNDSIELGSASGATVAIYSDGSKDSVSGANFNQIASDGDYDDEDNTTLYFNGDLSKAKFSLNSATSTVLVQNGTGKLYFSNNQANVPLTKETENKTQFTKGVGFKVTNGSSTYNVEVVEEKANATLLDGTTAVFGNKSGIVLASDASDTVIDLGNTGKYGDTTYYNGITKASAGDSGSDVVLIGSSKEKNTLTAGTGNTSLYGGGSKADLLVGKSTEGANTFFYGSGDGRDTVTGYKYNADDDSASDKLYILTTDFAKVTRTTLDSEGSSTMKFVFGSGTSNTLSVSTKDAVDTAVAYTYGGTDYKAKVGVTTTDNTFTYDDSVAFYVGGKKTDTLTVSDGANIWLDGSQGKGYTSINAVDASASLDDVTIAGGSSSETLIGGQGSNSLWGGASGNDTLVGNSNATTTFFFGKGNGSDVISASNSEDRVMLYDVALSDLKSYDVNTSGAMVIALNDGSKLTVNGISDSTVHTFTLSDGSSWTYSNGTWEAAE